MPHLSSGAPTKPHVEARGFITSVSIQSATNIWYTGAGIDSSNYLLVRHWNGKVLEHPLNTLPYRPSDAGQTVLSLSSTATWIIANGSTEQNPLRILRFNGTHWNTYASPPIHGEVVNAMAAVNANDIWAVGSSGPLTSTFTMHWNGTRWQHITSPNVPGRYNSLWGVSARAANDVWAVGSQQGVDGGDTPLIMHWNGTTWTIMPTPPIAKLPAHALNAVTIVSQNDVWAVGLGGLIEHWNGTRWSIVSSPISTPNLLSLNAISAYASNDIWVVGQALSCPSGNNCIARTYTKHWNGHTWQVVPSPSLSVPGETTSNLLLAVHTFAANNTYAMGKTDDKVFLAHWNGTAWKITMSHNLYF
ncbi:MAG TPA: hypothetical protein VGN34_09395 [Ktedonobacteraceae bacterium]